jgi:hypothetical protein
MLFHFQSLLFHTRGCLKEGVICLFILPLFYRRSRMKQTQYSTPVNMYTIHDACQGRSHTSGSAKELLAHQLNISHLERDSSCHSLTPNHCARRIFLAFPSTLLHKTTDRTTSILKLGLPLDEPIIFDDCWISPFAFQSIYVMAFQPLKQGLRVKLRDQMASSEGFKNIVATDPQGNELIISLRRTVPVPDNGKPYNLPPDFGSFPIFNTHLYLSKLPVDLSAKGGAFIPLYRRCNTGKAFFEIY